MHETKTGVYYIDSTIFLLSKIAISLQFQFVILRAMVHKIAHVILISSVCWTISIGFVSTGISQEEDSSVQLELSISEPEILPYQPFYITLTLKNHTKREIKSVNPDFFPQISTSWGMIQRKKGSFMNIRTLQADGTSGWESIKPGEETSKTLQLFFPEVEVNEKGKQKNSYSYAFRRPGRYSIKWKHKIYIPHSKKFVIVTSTSNIEVIKTTDLKAKEQLRTIARLMKMTYGNAELEKLQKAKREIKSFLQNVQDSEYKKIGKSYEKLISQMKKRRKKMIEDTK